MSARVLVLNKDAQAPTKGAHVGWSPRSEQRRPGDKLTRSMLRLAGSHQGHYNVRDYILPLAHLADSSTAVEALGLIPSAPALRPADLLTSAALPGRLAALDIGITSPDAAAAGDDCCQAMYDRKRHDYRQHLQELEAQDITYRPMVWSAWGRAHPETVVMLDAMARQAARRRGLRDHRFILRRTNAAVGAQIMRRAVRMCLACVPHLEEAESHLFLNAPDESVMAPQRRIISLVGDDADCRHAECVASV